MLSTYEVKVPDAWTDHYGHMNEGYYVVAASDASWELQAKLGIGTDYYDKTGCALITVESHVRYLDEVSLGEILSFNSLLLAVDSKRLHIGHTFHVGDRNCGTIECLWLHFDHNAGRVKPFSDDQIRRLQEQLIDESPPWAGRNISLQPRQKA